MSIIAKDKNEDVYIGVGLPLTHNKSGFFYRTKTSLEQAKSNIKNLLLTKSYLLKLVKSEKSLNL